MATGKPVIASNLPGVRSVVDDGENGFLVVPGSSEDLTSKINRLLINNELCSLFGTTGRKKVEWRYNWPSIVKNLEATLLDIS